MGMGRAHQALPDVGRRLRRRRGVTEVLGLSRLPRVRRPPLSSGSGGCRDGGERALSPLSYPQSSLNPRAPRYTPTLKIQ